MSEYIKIDREIYPACKLPSNLNTTVWRYMDIEKFYSLLDKKSLYLCRADLLQDRFEGTYSRRQIFEMEDWFKSIGKPDLSKTERERRKQDRLKTYISCWCISDCDLDLMWKGYIGNSQGVAIKSSIKSMVQLCDNAVGRWPLDISTVDYFDHANGEPINYFGTPQQFLYKDHHFRLDNELRIIYHPNITTPSPDHFFLSVDLKILIEEVVLQPQSTKNNLKLVRKALDDVGLTKIPILTSRDDREVIA